MGRGFTVLQHLTEPQPCSLCCRMPQLRFFSAGELIFLFLCDSSRRLTWSVFLSSTIKVDDFTARLFRIYVQVLEEGLAQVPWQGIPVVVPPGIVVGVLGLWQQALALWTLSCPRLVTPCSAMSCHSW